jgi:hypothetical protein
LCTACQRNVNGVVFCEPCLAARLQDPVAAQGAKPTSQVILEQGLGLKNVRNPNAVLAAILALIPGVGAMYNGQFLKGLIYAGIYALLIGMIDHGGGVFVPIVLTAFIAFMIFDAYHAAKAIAAGLPVPDPLGLDRIFGTGVGTGTMNPMGVSPRPVPPAPGAVPPGTPGYQPVPPAAGYAPVAPPAPAPEDYRAKAPVGAIILIGLGVLFLLENMGVWAFHFSGLWPLILIAIGAWLFVQRWNR